MHLPPPQPTPLTSFPLTALALPHLPSPINTLSRRRCLQTVADLMSLSGMYPALASQQSWAAQMGLSAASASRGSTGTGFMQVPQGASSAGGMDGKVGAHCRLGCDPLPPLSLILFPLPFPLPSSPLSSLSLSLSPLFTRPCCAATESPKLERSGGAKRDRGAEDAGKAAQGGARGRGAAHEQQGQGAEQQGDEWTDPESELRGRHCGAHIAHGMRWHWIVRGIRAPGQGCRRSRSREEI